MPGTNPTADAAALAAWSVVSVFAHDIAGDRPRFEALLLQARNLIETHTMTGKETVQLIDTLLNS